MKKIVSLLALFLFVGVLQTSAQNTKDDKVEALKIAFITERLQLTSKEAEGFWPVYHTYQKEVASIRKTNKNRDVLENEEKLLDIKKKYKPSFEKVIGEQKTMKFYQSEKDFRALLIKRLKNRKNR
ncbi:MAG: hypothetical protein J5I50_06915 [Chitinophagaceae bacterium]|nr:hypothetical protein [Chitinophagaceae bacterium]